MQQPLRLKTISEFHQHIHLMLIEKAKELLSTTPLTVSEIVYTLGFEQIQSFSRLFKTKTNVSPSSSDRPSTKRLPEFRRRLVGFCLK
jgi:AraC-like DNA-binding protein